jgi:RNA polymerase sigma factor (sigma-70 family)
VPVTENELLAARFEQHRTRLRGVAYRMLGSLAEAEDAVQEAWLNVSRAGDDGVRNLGGWLTTVTARVCLDMLRSRVSRREEPLGERPEPTMSRAEAVDPEAVDPEQEAVLADSVGLALLVVLDTLGPAERLAFVLHDMFAVPFEEIAAVVGRSPAATRQLASRARRRVQGADPVPRAHLSRQRAVVEAFLAAARGGDFDALVAVLDPDVVLRVDAGAVGAAPEVHGASAVAGQALTFSRGAPFARAALVNGTVGFVVAPLGRLRVAFGFTIADDRIIGIDVVSDARRLGGLELAVLDA